MSMPILIVDVESKEHTISLEIVNGAHSNQGSTPIEGTF